MTGFVKIDNLKQIQEIVAGDIISFRETKLLVLQSYDEITYIAQNIDFNTGKK